MRNVVPDGTGTRNAPVQHAAREFEWFQRDDSVAGVYCDMSTWDDVCILPSKAGSGSGEANQVRTSAHFEFCVGGSGQLTSFICLVTQYARYSKDSKVLD